MRYRMMYRERLSPSALSAPGNEWDILISAYNDSDRVLSAFEKLPASLNVWVLQSEYGYDRCEIETGDKVIGPLPSRESHFVETLLGELGSIDGARICVDITGFMRHTLLALVRALVMRADRRFWLVYSDPIRYVDDEDTIFSGGIEDVRQIDGFQGSHDVSDTDRDLLILGTGYDEGAMRSVVEFKRHARRIDLLGLPSLQPSMYGENVLSVAELREGGGERDRFEVIYAGANDPFDTAEALHAKMGELGVLGDRNVYLAPTGTKAQVVGFGLYFLSECQDTTASILLPLPEEYSRETSEGHSRSWLYEIDCELLLAGHSP